MDDSRKLIEGLHRLSQAERRKRVQMFCGLDDDEMKVLGTASSLSSDIAEHLIENVIGSFPIPLGVATNFNIDGRDVLIPMAVEETSIVAAASATAKWVRAQGSIRTFMQGNLIIGQVQIPSVKHIERAKKILTENRLLLIQLANACVPGLVARGGGVRDIAIREVNAGPNLFTTTERMNDAMLVIHILCDPCDAMGANLINQVCEALKPRIEQLTDEKVGLCILSNLVDTKLACAEVFIRNVDPKIGEGIVEATRFAQADPYRAATHNKGVLNGIDPILIATGNDWRAVESGIHAYAARSGRYQPVTDWKMHNGDLVGRFEAPLVVGTVGGVTRVHPVAKIALKILGTAKADELARICAAVGLVQNLGALKALSTVGIVKGHMQLHAANLAIAAGADPHEIEPVRQRLSQILRSEKHINLSHATKILESIRIEAR